MEASGRAAIREARRRKQPELSSNVGSDGGPERVRAHSATRGSNRTQAARELARQEHHQEVNKCSRWGQPTEVRSLVRASCLRDGRRRWSSPILMTLSMSLASLVALSQMPSQAGAQCPDKTMTSFERIGGVTIKDAALTVLFSAPNSSLNQAPGAGHLLESSRQLAGSSVYPITAECNNRCRRNSRCRAFLVDYGRHTCWSVEQPAAPAASSGGLSRAPTPIHLAATHERTAYFEKVCLNLPAVDCERAWIFERSIGHQLLGLDDKIIDEVPSRLRCQEHCLQERDFRCRSGEYDYVTMQCRLSGSDRHLKPAQFRPTSQQVDYFENQCVAVGQQCDSFERFDELDLGRAEIMRLTNSSDQCQHYCTHTIKAFICRSFTWAPASGKCYLNSANTHTVGGLDRLQPAPGLVYFQRTDCVDLKLDCDTSHMTLNLRTSEPFRGRMYVRDDPMACESIGRSALVSSLQIPFQSQARCATRELPSRYSSVVVVQQHPLIQRKSDRYIKLVCDFQTSNRTITSAYNVMANPWTSTALINATSLAPKIRLRITDKFANDITGAKLGDELQLRIEAESESVYDMVARSVVAKSGTTDESIVLIDRDGCPADSRIFPPLRKLSKRVIIGNFDAFKFSSDVVVRFQVDVQFCLNSCPPTSCDQQQQRPQQHHQQPAATMLMPMSGSPIAGAGPESYSAATSLEPAGTTTGRPPMVAEPTGRLQPSHQHPQESGPGRSRPSSSTTSTSTTSSPAADELAAGGQLDQFVIPLGQRQVAAADGEPLDFGQSGRQLGSRSAEPAEPLPAGHDEPSRPRPARTQRRRRAVEPMPDRPKHVPLQREIIVIESTDDSKRTSASRQPARVANGDNAHASDNSVRPGARLEPRTSSRQAGASATGAANKDRREPQARSSPSTQNHQYRLDPPHDEPPIEAADGLDEEPAERPVRGQGRSQILCTTWGSLVWAGLAFCALQLLTIGLCLAAWLHRRRHSGPPPKAGPPMMHQPHQQQAGRGSQPYHGLARGQFGLVGHR